MVCEYCKADVNSLVIHDDSLWCWTCHNKTKLTTGQSAAVIPDDIPGGIEIRHGICNEDGTPRKYYSKSEIKQAAFEQGWSIHGDTPKINQRIVEREKARLEERHKRASR
jgi:hypothetical protein